MLNLLNEIDFSKQLVQESELKNYLQQAAKFFEKQEPELIQKFKKPVFDEDLQNHLIVTNIPDLTGKQQKFIAFIKGFFDKKQIGHKQGLESMEVGFVEVNGVKKYNRTLYLIYKNPQVAKKAYQKLHQFKFDKENTFSCFTVREFKQVQNLEQKYIEPKFVDKNEVVLKHVMDSKTRDQFTYTLTDGNNSKIIVKWFDHVQKKVQDFQIEQQKNASLGEGVNQVVYSPKGILIAVCKNDGIRILNANTFEQKGFYKHQGVTNVIFSPDETYMISHNEILGNKRSQQIYLLWAVDAEVALERFKAQPQQSLGSFQFSKDQSKLAVLFTNEFVSYNCQSVQVLKKQLKLSQQQLIKQGKLIKVQNLQKLAWLDSVSVVAVCHDLNPSPQTNPTSKILTINTETKQQKKWKAIGQHIKKVEITVSDKGDWVSVFFKKIQKKNVSTSNFYFVNLKRKEKQMETEIHEQLKNIVSVSWDKQNARFAAVHEIPAAVKNDDIKFGVVFYQIHFSKDSNKPAIQIGRIDETPANRVILSQNSTFFALYNISPLSWGRYRYSLGMLTRDQKSKKYLTEIIKKDIQIPYMTFFNMDESGRFIITGTAKTYQIWTTGGELITKDMFSSEIKNVSFRPRFSVKLPAEVQAKIEQKEKELKKKYEDLDFERLNVLEFQKKREKQEKVDAFKKYLQQKKAWFTTFKAARDAIRGFNQQDPKVRSAKYQHQYLQNNGK